MAWLLKCTGPVFQNRYLRFYNPEGNDGYGDIEFTSDPGEAKKYESVNALRADVDTVPQNRPTKENGDPNKPLDTFQWRLVREEDVR
jgi:hypothetical protein